jgi:hypothetical protein
MIWNTEKIIEDCGGPNDLHAALTARGYEITVQTVRAWGRRKHIPSNWLAEIFDLKAASVPPGWITEDIF